MKIALISTPFIRVPPQGYGGTELFCYEPGRGAHRARPRRDPVHDRRLGGELPQALALPPPQWPPTAPDEVNHVAWSLQEVNKQSFDIVHLNTGLGVPLATLVRAPVVCTVHHCRDEPTSRVFAAHPGVHYVGISDRQLELEVPLPSSRVISPRPLGTPLSDRA